MRLYLLQRIGRVAERHPKTYFHWTHVRSYTSSCGPSNQKIWSIAAVEGHDRRSVRLMSCRPGSRQPLSYPALIMTVDSDNSPSPADNSEPPSTSEKQPTLPHEHVSSVPTTPVSNRSELLDRARHFLSSPQVIHQDHESKRRFLTEKGLTDGEILLLLREMVRRGSPPHGPYLAHTSVPALAAPPRATPCVPRPTSVPSSRPSCGYLQTTFVDHGGLHSLALYLLRASSHLHSTLPLTT